MLQKFHEQFGIGCSPAQRLTRKSKGIASAILTVYWPEGAKQVHWLMLVTPGTGFESEQLHEVSERPFVTWLGYELTRHTARGRAAWTWRRPKTEMAEHYAMLENLLKQRNSDAVSTFLQCLANQPGFHGVRAQSWELCQEARKKGHAGKLPFLFFLQKVSHGEPFVLSTLK